MSSAGQHQFQRSRRTDRLYAAGCLPLLHGQRHRGARGRQLLPPQARPAAVAETRLQEHVRARLIGLQWQGASKDMEVRSFPYPGGFRGHNYRYAGCTGGHLAGR